MTESGSMVGDAAALIKVGSETIASRSFHERFFELVEKILAGQKGLD